MLFNVSSNKYIKHIPYEKDYNIWKSRLFQEEIDAIFDELNKRFNNKEVDTSSWIPGSDWTGTVFQPIYEKACRYNAESAGLCFGLMVWEVVLNHPETWGYGRYEKDGVTIKGITYFRLPNQP